MSLLPYAAAAGELPSAAVVLLLAVMVPTILLGFVGVRTLTISAHATAAPRGP